MKARIDRPEFHKLAPEIRAALGPLTEAAKAPGGLEPALLELVKLRASQVNGCAFCLDMHAREARTMGESEHRLHVLTAWREAPAFSERERAALAWTEALTLVTDGHVPDAVYEDARRNFSERELAYLTAAVVAINSWNRVAIAFRFLPRTPAA